MMRSVACLACLLVGPPLVVAQPAFRLAPAVAIEAEQFTIESGWKVVANGQGNYMVDAIGFNHISGERVLSLESKASSGRARATVQVPQAGDYRLWVRYEYPAFTEARFRVRIEQAGKTRVEQVLGRKESLRYAALTGKMEAKAQHDPPWGPEGLMEEVVTVPGLAAGPAVITLEGVEQPQVPGRAANRNVDLLYLTSDTRDAWLGHYLRGNTLYPILDAVRDTVGPRWEVRLTNGASTAQSYRIHHIYNRIPWGFSEPAAVPQVPAGATSEWVGLRGQDTAHFSAISVSGQGKFSVEVRPVGGKEATRKFSGEGTVTVYLPTYPRADEAPRTPEEAIDAILAELKKSPAPGKKPTKPLCYGGWLPLGQDNAYGRKYAALYAALGFRSLHPAHSGPAQVKNLQAVGVEPSKSWMVMGYRNPPTLANIGKARAQVEREGMLPQLRFFDYGDEIGFSEWLGMLTAEVTARDKRLNARQVVTKLWLEWLKANRPRLQIRDYWLEEWGPVTAEGFRPDSSAKAAKQNPRLYVDSLLFYEEMAIRFAAEGARAVRTALGSDVLCGANYSCHPFYYPHSTMYIKWFRQGAADLGRHSEYFWQVAQLGPMVNGYIAEHFVTGMRENPRAVLRQYTMPHAPGNTDASFLRSAFTHLAHGATMLDFFGIGLNETFTENHIDHRAVSRFRALRDVTHAVGLVEDLLPQSRPVPSEVALLVSESTERWDYAGIAEDLAGHAHFGPEFRKARLHFHLERLGLWKMLTLTGHAPDLVTEEDVAKNKLGGKKLLILVGDHWRPDVVPAVETFVRGGGVVLATAGAGQRDSYAQPLSSWHALAGLKKVTTQTRTPFLRPRQELAFLTPLDTVRLGETDMPVLATHERIEPAADARVLATFASDKSPACVERELERGRVLYVASHPGLAFLWKALQTPLVADRGPNTHSLPATWDTAPAEVVRQALKQAGATPLVESPGLTQLDMRLLEAPGGYILPIANYGAAQEKVRLRIRVGKPVRQVISAYHGPLKATTKAGTLEVILPALTFGDVLRLER
ncbi:MAG: beta-galactosidase trimerization domain-containing protein [Gemmataceae bacterium]